jgi:hypothetical protein
LLCGGLLANAARADTFHLTDGQTVTGDIVSMDDSGIVLKLPDGSYADRLPWTKVTQADLKDLLQNPKAADFVGPFIEESAEEKNKHTEIEIKDVPRLGRPAGHSLLGAMFTSSLGLVTLLILYAGNLYAAYEVSIFRAQPAGLVCGVSAAVPVLGPVIFLAMPTKLRRKQEEWQATAEEHDPGMAAAIAAEQAQESPIIADSPEAAAYAAAPAAKPKTSLPPTRTFPRGQYTFNRRFFETQLAAFFAMTRPEAERDKVLTFKASRGTYIAQRISRISANDLHLQVIKGAASEEVAVPFVEIQEVELKHKDA